MESLSDAVYSSLCVAIKVICKNLCKAQEVGIDELPTLAEQAVLDTSYLLISFQRMPKSNRCFPNVRRKWLGSDGTIYIMYYVHQRVDDLTESTEMYLEQLSMGIVLALMPPLFLDDHLTLRTNFDSFRRDWPQLFGLADEVCGVMRELISVR